MGDGGQRQSESPTVPQKGSITTPISRLATIPAAPQGDANAVDLLSEPA
jgi:hypothetical protein